MKTSANSGGTASAKACRACARHAINRSLSLGLTIQICIDLGASNRGSASHYTELKSDLALFDKAGALRYQTLMLFNTFGSSPKTVQTVVIASATEPRRAGDRPRPNNPGTPGIANSRSFNCGVTSNSVAAIEATRKGLDVVQLINFPSKTYSSDM